MIWKKTHQLEQLNRLCENSAISHLGIRFTAKGDNWLEAEMPVDQRTCQPLGFLHGGISAALAETVASLAGFCTLDDNLSVVGVELNASHLRAVKKGNVEQQVKVIARAEPLRLGKSLQVWQVDIFSQGYPLGGKLQSGERELCCRVRMTLAVINRHAQKRINNTSN
ncbi:esterase [Mergibacter septicus]|uniref:hotdog fold thioesterase n=1 Tax=Mergibacter septicus TaxID=221402 RepID=UPI00117904F4|nr:hotdog fold thioesterase [Mergibacter septicus]AWX13717.1 esterase [Mergibacter septicus]